VGLISFTYCVVLVVLWLFGGVQPPYPKLADQIPVIGPIMNGISPFRWSFQLLIVVELNNYSEVWSVIVDAVYSRYGYSHKYVLQAGMLIVYSVVVNILAYCVLALKRDNYLLVKLTIERGRKKWRRLRGKPEPPSTAPLQYQKDSFEALSMDDIELGNLGFAELTAENTGEMEGEESKKMYKE